MLGKVTLLTTRWDCSHTFSSLSLCLSSTYVHALTHSLSIRTTHSFRLHFSFHWRDFPRSVNSVSLSFCHLPSLCFTIVDLTTDKSVSSVYFPFHSSLPLPFSLSISLFLSIFLSFSHSDHIHSRKIQEQKIVIGLLMENPTGC